MTLSSNFSVTAHITDIISSCSQSLYALLMLRAHGMDDRSLHTVFSATVLSKLSYASPAWWGFTNSSDRDRLEAFMKRAASCIFYAEGTLFSHVCDRSDAALFHTIASKSSHPLHKILPRKTS